ncbi:substrate-binding domain-containing protein [Variovorax sp. M-6]|uniref:LacI family DNA-binding transcriptional regulator n=1 Tax=Variovorax sp. M-6 TaxID=3233041 RepID=UPI003F986A9B
MQDRKIRIHDVAALAGVSVGSASRVLNRAANVSTEVREKVERAIAALHYQPSHVARTLRSRSSMTIGCMFSDVTNPLYARAFRALEEGFRADGYMLLLANGLNNVQRELDILRTFQLRGMDGVIYAPGHERDPALIELVDSMPMPVVLYDRDLAAARADAVLFDHANGVKDVCARLFEFGHTRIALALWNAGSRPVRRRIEGYKAAYRAAGMEPPDLILRQPTPTSSVFDDLLRLLDAPNPPTALIAQGTHILVSALRAVAKTGRRIPQDFSVVSIGDSDFAQTHDPAITVLSTNTEVVASHAKTLLLERLSGTVALTSPPRKITIPYDLAARESWGPCRR